MPGFNKIKAILEEAGWIKPDKQEKWLYKVVVCPTGGPEDVVSTELWLPKRDLTLEFWQEHVGGHIETLPAYHMELPDKMLLAVLNENARNLDLSRNYLIGEWLEHESDDYFGPALVTTWLAFE